MDNGHENAFPHVPLATDEVSVLDSILLGNIGYLRNNAPFSKETAKRIQELQDLRERILFLRGGDGHAALVTLDDIRVLREAMITFVKLTRRVVPQSSERDETLKSVNTLRKYLEMQLFPEKRKDGR